MSHDLESIDTPLLDARFEFARVPAPVPAALQPERRVPLLLLLVAKSHGSGAAWKTLQLLNWVTRATANADLVVGLRRSEDIPHRPIVRIDPVLDRALDLAVGLGLLESRRARSFRLTDNGRQVVETILATDAFERERAALDRLQGKLTQRQVDQALEWREG